MGKELIDETGKIYGKLKVIKPIRSGGMRKTGWLCECECGNTIICYGSDLRTGKRTSCGKHCNSIKNEIGNTYGFLTVIEKDLTPATQFPDQSIHWICKCQLCNTIKSVSGRLLRNGEAKSCGCLKSTGEQSILNYFNKNNINFKKEYSFSDLKDKLPLRFDFGLFNDNNKLIGLIEYQGRQHFQEIEYFQKDNGLNGRIKRDNMKKEYCIKNNIPLLYIIPKNINHPELSDYNNIGTLIEEFIEEIKGENNNVKIFSKYV